MAGSFPKDARHVYLGFVIVGLFWIARFAWVPLVALLIYLAWDHGR